MGAKDGYFIADSLLLIQIIDIFNAVAFKLKLKIMGRRLLFLICFQALLYLERIVVSEI